MSKREEAIEAITHAICEADGMHGEDYRACATAAFDAAIQFLMEPDEAIVSAVLANGPCHESMRLLLPAIFQAMLKGASA